MRRCLHSLLVGFLTLSLTVDAARACGHLRRCRQCPAPCPTPVVVSHGVVPGCWVVPVVVVADGCGCTRVAVVGPIEDIACGVPLDCCGATVRVVETTPAADPVVETVVVPQPGGTGPAATPAEAVPSPVASAVPTLEPVEPASATVPTAEPVVTAPAGESAEPAPAVEPAPEPEVPAEPEKALPEPEGEAEEMAPEEEEIPAEEPAVEEPAVDEPVAMPEEPAPREEEPVSEPEPRNVFEDADEAPADEAPGDEAPGDEAPGDEPGAVAEPPMEEEAVAEPAADEELPVPDASEEPTEPEVADPPSSEPADEPADEPAGAENESAAVEPLRRWIDDTASFAVVGRLVDVRGDVVEILKTDGRRVTVPLVRLSGFDREYVSQAGPRVAAGRPGPRPFDTAGR